MHKTTIPFLNLADVTAMHGDEIRNALTATVNSGWYIHGRENEAFEKAYSAYIGVRHTIGVANGLDALTLVLRAYIEMGVMNPGDEVLVSAHTYIATILSITENGLVPVFIEPDIHSYNIDDSKIEVAITAKTKALMIVHLYGQCAYTEKIKLLCSRYNLKLIEDNAQACGCLWETKKTGALGDAAGHSFYPGKNLGALGDGGAVTTDDSCLADLVRSLANYGSSKKYIFDHKGRNSRLDELQAAVLRIKLAYLDEDNQRRKVAAKQYLSSIDNPRIVLPRVEDMRSHVFHIFPVLARNRNDLQTYLAGHDVETLIHYPVAPHKQLCYREYAHLHLPVTERIHEEELSLPISPCIAESDIQKIIELLNRWK